MSHLHGLPSEAARVLVVANHTADSDELVEAIRERDAQGPARFTLVVPTTPSGLAWAADMSAGIPAALRQMRIAEDRLQEAGVWVDDVRLGCPEPLTSVIDATNAADFDEVVVCTLPRRLSRWLRLALPQRVERTTGLPVTHVVAHSAGVATDERAALAAA
jgi:hypothetical protein